MCLNKSGLFCNDYLLLFYCVVQLLTYVSYIIARVVANTVDFVFHDLHSRATPGLKRQW